MARRFIEFNYNPQEGFTVRVNPMRIKLVPDETRDHLMAANKEMLLAMRSILDAAISRMERREEAPRGPRRVEVKQEGEARG